MAKLIPRRKIVPSNEIYVVYSTYGGIHAVSFSQTTAEKKAIDVHKDKGLQGATDTRVFVEKVKIT